MGGERAPDLKVERRLSPAPQHDLRLVAQRARRHAKRERDWVEIERATGVEDARGCRPGGDKADLAMRHVNQAVGGPVEYGFEHFAKRRGIGAVRDQEPFVGPEPESRAVNAFASRPKPLRGLGPESDPAGETRALPAPQDEAGGRRRLGQGESRTRGKREALERRAGAERRRQTCRRAPGLS